MRDGKANETSPLGMTPNQQTIIINLLEQNKIESNDPRLISARFGPELKLTLY